MDTEEDAFWSHLEANPSDSVARLVFADWLQERGDLRAEGMRVLGLLQKQAGHWAGELRDRSGCWFWASKVRPERSRLAELWWARFYDRVGGVDSHSHMNRCECETLAALSWLELTQEERDGICKLD